MKARSPLLFCASLFFFGCVVVTTGGKAPPGANPGDPAPGDPAPGGAVATARQPASGASCLVEGEYPDGPPAAHRGRGHDLMRQDARCCSGKVDPQGRCRKERSGHACNEARVCEKGSSCIDGNCCLGLGVSMDTPGAIGMAPAGSQCCPFLHINPLRMAQQPVQCVQITKGPPGAACKDNLECDSLYCRDGKCLSKYVDVGAHCGSEEDVAIGRDCSPGVAECLGMGDKKKCVRNLHVTLKELPAANCRANGARCSPTASPGADPYGRTPCCGFCGKDGTCH